MERSLSTAEAEPHHNITSSNNYKAFHPATAFLLYALMACFSPGPSCSAETVTVYPAPKGEPLSPDYTVEANGRAVPIYLCKVAPSNPQRRWKAMDDKTNSATFFETAAFVYFDAASDTQIDIDITAREPIRAAKVLPSALHIQPAIDARNVRFRVSGPYPRHLTVELNGTWQGALHLFINPMEEAPPLKDDPRVIYFGPGIHDVTNIIVGDNQTVYIAGGAIVRGIIGKDEKFSVSSYSGLKNYSPTFLLQGTNISFRGRGIVDGSLSTTHARNLLYVRGTDISLEGIILRDSSTWTVPIRQSERVRVNNLKLLGYRANSDGIDICNSRDVTVENCFIRTLDDLIVIKTDKGQGKCYNIVAKKCVLWNEVAHALSVGAELREDVDNVVFRDCDVIHDFGREWTLRIYHCDSARIRNIRFEDLRIEQSPRLMSLWIDKAVWTRDAERGHVDNVLFKDIHAGADPLRVELKGYNDAHLIENVQFDNVTVNGRPLKMADINTNAFVRGVSLKP